MQAPSKVALYYVVAPTICPVEVNSSLKTLLQVAIIYSSLVQFHMQIVIYPSNSKVVQTGNVCT